MVELNVPNYMLSYQRYGKLTLGIFKQNNFSNTTHASINDENTSSIENITVWDLSMMHKGDIRDELVNT